MALTQQERARVASLALDETYVGTLRTLWRWIHQHGEHGRAHPGVRRLARERGKCDNTACAHLRVLRNCGLIERVGRRGWFDKAARTWVRMADTYRVTRAGAELLKRHAPQQEDALHRLVKAAPPRRGCPQRVWLVNLVQFQAQHRQKQREADAVAAPVRAVLSKHGFSAQRTALPPAGVSPQAENAGAAAGNVPPTPTHVDGITHAGQRSGLRALADALGIRRPPRRPPT